MREEFWGVDVHETSEEEHLFVLVWEIALQVAAAVITDLTARMP